MLASKCPLCWFVLIFNKQPAFIPSNNLSFITTCNIHNHKCITNVQWYNLLFVCLIRKPSFRFCHQIDIFRGSAETLSWVHLAYFLADENPQKYYSFKKAVKVQYQQKKWRQQSSACLSLAFKMFGLGFEDQLYKIVFYLFAGHQSEFQASGTKPKMWWVLDLINPFVC